MIHGGSWDFVPHSVGRACLPASQEGSPRATWLQGSFLHPSCCILGAGLAKPAVLFSTYSPGNSVFPKLPDTQVPCLEQQGEPRNQISECALCTVVLLSSSAASAPCKQAAQLMFDLPMPCSLVEQQQQQLWQTVLTPLGDRMPSPGILATFPVGQHCPRNWVYFPLPQDMQTRGCGAPLTHGAGGSCVHCQ